MKTLSYIRGCEEEVEIGEEYYFGQLWDGKGDGEELLESGSIWIGDDENDMPIIAEFKTIEKDEDSTSGSLVLITGFC